VGRPHWGPAPIKGERGARGRKGDGAGGGGGAFGTQSPFAMMTTLQLTVRARTAVPGAAA
jgi:hypothetical protein